MRPLRGVHCGHDRRRIALAAVLLVMACSSSEPSDRAADGTTSAAPTTSTVDAGTCPDRLGLPYVEGGDPLQQLDLHRPTDAGCRPVPVVVWVHGGGWQAGDKANQLAPKLALWHDAEWAVVSVNYRLTDLSTPEADRVLAPDHNEDVAAAIAFLVSEAERLGIDATRLALLGHSAGAGIVAALATDPGYLGAHDVSPTDLACVAPLDTEAFDVAAVIAGGGQLATLYRSVFGDDPARWAELSPLSHVGEAEVPDLFLVTRGTPARRAQVTAFASAATAAGAPVTSVDLPGFTHADVNNRVGDPADEVLTPALQAFLASCLD